MKQISMLVIALIFIAACGTTNSSGVIKGKFVKEAEAKVEKMQNLIKFSDEQAFKLKKLEVQYLNELAKIQHCKDCNKEELMKKNDIMRDIQLQNILERHEYLKYDAFYKERVKQIELMAK